MEYTNSKIAPYAKVAVKLLQGAVFDDQKEVWDEMLKYQIEITQFYEKIALDLIIDKRDGYAFLKQIEIDDKGSTIGLVRRTPLSYELTLVCVLLREWLDEFDASDTESKNLYITPKSFRERLEMFFKEKANEVKFIKELNRYLIDIEKMGFVKMVNENSFYQDENQYQVRRIVKARFTNDELMKFKILLENDV